MFTLTSLNDNQVFQAGLRAEHGFAVLIEFDDQKLLFDTGQSGLFLENAQKMRVDLAHLNGIIISHGHYDHMGGLMPLLHKNGKAKIFAMPGIFIERYSKNNGKRYIGAPHLQTEYEKAGAKFLFNQRPFFIRNDIVLSGKIERKYDQERVTDPFLKVDSKNQEQADSIDDEQALFIKGRDGLNVITGCGHAGLINTLEYAIKITGEKKINTIIGGFHLKKAPSHRVSWTIDQLKTINFKKIIPSHCTGPRMSGALLKHFPDQTDFMAVGESLQLN
ncbi:MAG: MBL fold metallo-hydrolase [Caldithrix sp.]|nr:MBL fold metallo-hydrolase [Caldithrix sp.]